MNWSRLSCQAATWDPRSNQRTDAATPPSTSGPGSLLGSLSGICPPGQPKASILKQRSIPTRSGPLKFATKWRELVAEKCLARGRPGRPAGALFERPTHHPARLRDLRRPDGLHQGASVVGVGGRRPHPRLPRRGTCRPSLARQTQGYPFKWYLWAPTPSDARQRGRPLAPHDAERSERSDLPAGRSSEGKRKGRHSVPILGATNTGYTFKWYPCVSQADRQETVAQRALWRVLTK